MMRLTILLTAIMAVASIGHAGMSSADARLKLWKSNNAQSNATATIDGNTILTINDSTTLAAEAMAISDVDVDAELAAYQAEQDAIATAPHEFANGIAVPAETNGWFYSIVPADDGTLVPVLYRQSPVDWAAYEARKAAKLDAVKTNAVDLAQLKIDVAATIDGLQNDVDHTVFAGAQRAEFNDLRRLCLDLAREVRRLRKSQAQEAD